MNFRHYYGSYSKNNTLVYMFTVITKVNTVYRGYVCYSFVPTPQIRQTVTLVFQILKAKFSLRML